MSYVHAGVYIKIGSHSIKQARRSRREGEHVMQFDLPAVVQGESQVTTSIGFV